MHRLVPAFDPPQYRMQFAALMAASEQFEAQATAGSAIIANTIAWMNGYSQCAPSPYDCILNCPTLAAELGEPVPLGKPEMPARVREQYLQLIAQMTATGMPDGLVEAMENLFDVYEQPTIEPPTLEEAPES